MFIRYLFIILILFMGGFIIMFEIKIDICLNNLIFYSLYRLFILNLLISSYYVFNLIDSLDIIINHYIKVIILFIKYQYFLMFINYNIYLYYLLLIEYLYFILSLLNLLLN